MRGDAAVKYLWEVLLEAKEEGIPEERLRFFHDGGSSAYLEIAIPFINETELGEEREIAVNTYCRFYDIFRNLFQPELRDYPQLRKKLTNVILHMLAGNDIRRGMTREEYYKKLLASDLAAGAFGEKAWKVFSCMGKEEKGILMSGWLRSCRTGSSLAIFIDLVHGLIGDSIVYHNNDRPDEILIYTRLKKTGELEERLGFLMEMFLDIRYRAEVFYEYHFGIIGVGETMQIGEIAMY